MHGGHSVSLPQKAMTAAGAPEEEQAGPSHCFHDLASVTCVVHSSSVSNDTSLVTTTS